jgi:alpha-glucosidase/alpha-D-xyloside xylohydrolase
MPVMRALWLGAPADQRALATDDAYFWGDALLVAPVSERGATERSVYLPRGLWYDFWTNGRIDGGTEVHARADLGTLPLFVRAGSILPMGPLKQFTTQRVDAPLEVNIYPGADGEFTLYQDDGVSMDHLRGASSVIHFAWSDAQRRLAVRLGERSRIGAYTSRSMVLRVIGIGTDRGRRVEFTGAEAVHQL